MGQYPVSIATSLALESLMGILETDPNAEDPLVNHTELLMVNIRTLLRNLYSSIETAKRVFLDEYTIAEALVNEMRTIESILMEASDGRCFAQFYYCTYVDANRKFPKALIKPVRTPAQQFYWKMEKTVIGFMTDDFKSGPGFKRYTTDFEETTSSAVIITHYPVDLLQRYKFSRLTLLESHTGAIKTPLMWNSKLQSTSNVDNLPFDKMTIQMFGDGVMFSPMPIKIRERVLEVAKKDNWTPSKTKDFVIASITNRRDPALEILVKEMYRN